MQKNRILVIDDNPDTRKFLENCLSSEFDPYVVENAILGIEYIRKQKPDLIVLDVMLPVLNGLDACSLLKKDVVTRSIPIIFLSAKSSVSDIVEGLGIGADDYLVKPFDPKELIARIKARLREKASWSSEPKTLVHGDLKLIIDSHDVFLGEKAVNITQTEFEILRILMQKPGQVVSRSEILNEVWKTNTSKALKRTIDVHVRSLRKKIPSLTNKITAVYGVGYRYKN